MAVEIPITFTLDTICPWTYLAKCRLAKALARVRESHPDVTVTVRYLPYQLNPELSSEGIDKVEFYRTLPYGQTEDRWKKYTALMTAYGMAEGIDFKFGGTMANTLPAHRLIYHFQESQGPETADNIVNGLYRRYFEEEKNPSSSETLLQAAVEAGVPEQEAKKFIEDQDEDLMDVKALFREQRGNGIDSVPYIIVEGKRRDFTLVGAKEVDEYVKTIEQCIKESK